MSLKEADPQARLGADNRPDDPRTVRSRRLALAGVAIASFLGCIDFTIVNTAVPAIQRELSVNVDQSRWIVSAFVMALSGCMVAAGRLADLYGRRRVMHLGILAFAIGSLGAGLAQHIGSLVAWRILQGMACAVLYTASAAIVSHAFPVHERGRAIGLLFSANGFGLAVGPVIGGLLVSAVGWRWVFLLNVPLALISLALCKGHVQESRAADHEAFDLPGLLLLISALPLLLLALGFGQDWGWTSWRTLGAGGAGSLLLGLLVAFERRTAFPLIRFDLFVRRDFLVAGLASAALAFFYCAAFFLMPLYLHTARGQGDAAIGWLLLPTTAVMAAASPLAGRWADRSGPSKPLLWGFLALALSAFTQAHLGASTTWTVVLTAFCLMGLGWGLILGPSTVAALAAVPAQLSGVATGAAWTLHNFGGALGLTLATSIFATSSQVPHQTGSAAFLTGFVAAMWALVIVTLSTAGLLVLTRRRR